MWFRQKPVSLRKSKSKSSRSYAWSWKFTREKQRGLDIWRGVYLRRYLHFPTLIKSELINNKLFKCTEQELSSFEKIIEWRLKFFNLPNVSRTCFDNEWKKDYYKALFPLNPNQLIPVLPSLEKIMRLES